MANTTVVVKSKLTSRKLQITFFSNAIKSGSLIEKNEDI